jgi:uncharacterized lipoprotein YehR (DUF1307 family)
MKKILLYLVIAILFMIAVTSCTQNEMTRRFGGTETVELSPGQRLINITWKGDSKESPSLWILTKYDTTSLPTTYSFKESSSYGIMEGEVIVKEK